MSDGYLRNRHFYQDVAGTGTVDSGDTEVSLVPTLGSVDGNLQTIFVQRGTLTVLNAGDPGTTWTLGDDQSAFITEDYAVGPDDARSYAFDFGAQGRALTEGAAFIVTCSAAGATGLISFEAYRKLTGVGAAQP